MSVKRIALITSGGDAPGMNACIRAVTRAAIARNMEVFGFCRGYNGIIDLDYQAMNSRSVSNIIQRGGTILKTARSERFLQLEYRQKAAENLRKLAIDGLIACGGNGTFAGLVDLAEVWDGQIIGVAGTIDNDIYGSDYTIGFDTAVNTVMQMIDRIRDTADAHERFFLVEVMGRHAGHIALFSGISGGAEEILVPETPTDLPAIAARLKAGKEAGKSSSIVVVAEGDEEGGAFEVAEKLKKISGLSYRVCILGHTQRGGSPTVRDRVEASEMGVFAVDSFCRGESGVFVARQKGELLMAPLAESGKHTKVSDYLVQVARILAN